MNPLVIENGSKELIQVRSEVGLEQLGETPVSTPLSRIAIVRLSDAQCPDRSRRRVETGQIEAGGVGVNGAEAIFLIGAILWVQIRRDPLRVRPVQEPERSLKREARAIVGDEGVRTQERSRARGDLPVWVDRTGGQEALASAVPGTAKVRRIVATRIDFIPWPSSVGSDYR
jgi:hypothetical protein